MYSIGISFITLMDVASHCVVLNLISTVSESVGKAVLVMSHRAYIEKNTNISVSVLLLYFPIKYHIS